MVRLCLFPIFAAVSVGAFAFAEDSSVSTSAAEASSTGSTAPGLRAGFPENLKGGSCSTPQGDGTCELERKCSYTSIPGYCNGPGGYQCCVDTNPTPDDNSCSTPQGDGTCKNVRLCKLGTSIPGYCSGDDNIQCCVRGAPDPSPVAPPTPTPPTSSKYGVDVSTTISSSAASCFASSGQSFVIPRGYTSTGHVDTQVCTSISNAAAGGVSVRDTYMFPCPTCSKSASTQFNELVSYLNANCRSQWSGRIWLDIEGAQYWLSSTSSNRAWYEDLVDACKKVGSGRCGVYSSASQWSAIFGSSSYSYGSNLPLWYAHYDNNPSFSDFSSFGGWRTPHAKQYAGDVTLCSMGVDKNYSPNF